MEEEAQTPLDGNVPIEEEVGSEEIDAFEKKARELAGHRKIDRFGSWTSTYYRKNDTMKIDIYAPGPAGRPNSSYDERLIVSVSQVLFESENGSTFTDVEEFILNPETREMEYREEILEWDKNGDRVPNQMKKKERENLELLYERLKLEGAFRTHIVTKDKMVKLIDLLSHSELEEEKS